MATVGGARLPRTKNCDWEAAVAPGAPRPLIVVVMFPVSVSFSIGRQIKQLIKYVAQGRIGRRETTRVSGVKLHNLKHALGSCYSGGEEELLAARRPRS